MKNIIMKTQITVLGQKIDLSAYFIDSVLQSKIWEGTPSNLQSNHFKIQVKTNQETASFDFYGTHSDFEKGGRVLDRCDLIGAFYCFINDSFCAEEGFENFISEFGYTDEQGKKIFKACEKSLNKYNRLFDLDIYDFFNDLQENYEDCI